MIFAAAAGRASLQVAVILAAAAGRASLQVVLILPRRRASLQVVLILAAVARIVAGRADPRRGGAHRCRSR